jgi:serine/threonine protein kinase
MMIKILKMIFECGKECYGCLFISFIYYFVVLLFFNEDVIEKKLGEGAFGYVYLVRNKNDKDDVLAMKVMKLGLLGSETYKKNAKAMMSELQIGMEIGHNSKYLVNLKKYQVEGEHCILFMEYCCGGDVEQYLKKEKKLTKEVYTLCCVVLYKICLFRKLKY